MVPGIHINYINGGLKVEPPEDTMPTSHLAYLPRPNMENCHPATVAPLPPISTITHQISVSSENSEDISPNGPPALVIPPNGMQAAAAAMELAQQLKRKEMFCQRKEREFIPDNKKDECYWDRRRRNNEAAKRSREKRRFNDMILEQRVCELTKENHILKAELTAIKEKYGITGESLISPEQILETLPSNEQLINVTRQQAKILAPHFFPYQNNESDKNEPNNEPSSPPRYNLPIPPNNQLPPHHRDVEGDLPIPRGLNTMRIAPLHRPPAEYIHQEQMHLYPPIYNQPNIHINENEALNLSREHIMSPHMNVQTAEEDLSSSPDDSQMMRVLPLKMRHKSHINDKEGKRSPSDSSNSPGISSLSGSGTDNDDNNDNVSSDERDSGIGFSKRRRVSEPTDDITNAGGGALLRDELQRLASEVATLKDILHYRRDNDAHS